MTKFKHLTAADRKAIEVLLSENYTVSDIALKLEVNRSTVCREINSRSTPAGYFADVAQLNYEVARKNSCRPKILSDTKTQNYVLAKLMAGYSPDEIRGRISLRRDPDTFDLKLCCNETIYNWIYDDPICKKDSVYQYLKQGKKDEPNILVENLKSN
jgi:IS30 family transposase